MVGTINTKSLLPKLSILMLTDLLNLPEDLTEETTLNGKYLKGIPTSVTDPNVDTGDTTHTHVPDGVHSHVGAVASHNHTGTSSVTPTTSASTTNGVVAPFNHTHSVSSDTQAVAEASIDGVHTHNAISNDLQHRTITFFKKTNTSIPMSRKALPRKMTFFYSKTGTFPAGLLENLNYVNLHFKGDGTPGDISGVNDHQHDIINHNHPTDISPHEHILNFGGSPNSPVAGLAGTAVYASGGHSHPPNTAETISKSSTPVTSGDGGNHQHDDISHEPSFKTLRLMEVNSVKMSNVGVPKNCVFLWLDLISLIVAGWQVSDGTNDTIDMLDIYPKGSATPDTTGGNDTHTHDEDTISHGHTGADVAHSHGTTGSSGSATTTTPPNRSGGGLNAAPDHSHTPGPVTAQAAQTITINNDTTNHNHGPISNDPESKTIAFVERINP